MSTAHHEERRLENPPAKFKLRIHRAKERVLVLSYEPVDISLVEPRKRGSSKGKVRGN